MPMLTRPPGTGATPQYQPRPRNMRAVTPVLALSGVIATVSGSSGSARCWVMPACRGPSARRSTRKARATIDAGPSAPTTRRARQCRATSDPATAKPEARAPGSRSRTAAPSNTRAPTCSSPVEQSALQSDPVETAGEREVVCQAHRGAAQRDHLHRVDWRDQCVEGVRCQTQGGKAPARQGRGVHTTGSPTRLGLTFEQRHVHACRGQADGQRRSCRPTAHDGDARFSHRYRVR